MSDLPKFIPDDPTAVTQELISAYEAMTGKTLYPAHVDRLMIDLIAYRESVTRAAINDTGRQNLVAFARAPMLDYLGELVGVSRLPAQSARGTVRLTFTEALASALAIPAETRVETGSGVQFQTEALIIVPAAATYADLAVVAIEPGSAANGYLQGQVNALVDDLGVDVDTVANLGVTLGGADEETDDRLRDRIRLAPESFTVAGSRLAYRHHALRAHQDIVDVAVVGPQLVMQNGQLVSQNGVPAGVVRLFPLVKSGLPGASILAAVTATCSADKTRPMTDLVEVLPPVEYPYAIRARLTLFSSADASTTLDTAHDAAAAYALTQSAALGRDPVPSQIVAVLSVAGVYQVELLEPLQALAVPPEGWAHCTEISVELAGGIDG